VSLSENETEGKIELIHADVIKLINAVLLFVLLFIIIATGHRFSDHVRRWWPAAMVQRCEREIESRQSGFSRQNNFHKAGQRRRTFDALLTHCFCDLKPL
jgi:hypothetical protein